MAGAMDERNSTFLNRSVGHVDPDVAVAGGLEVIFGPAMSGKTTALIERLQLFSALGLKAICFYPILPPWKAGWSTAIYGEGKEFPAIGIRRLSLDGEIEFGDANVIGIDDGQMFGENIASVCDMLASMQKRVIVATMNLNIERKPYPGIGSLICLADSVVQLRAGCVSCVSREKAIFSQLTCPAPLGGCHKQAVNTRRIAGADLVDGVYPHVRVIGPTCPMDLYGYVGEDYSPHLGLLRLEEDTRLYIPLCRSCMLAEEPATFADLAVRRSSFRLPRNGERTTTCMNLGNAVRFPRSVDPEAAGPMNLAEWSQLTNPSDSGSVYPIYGPGWSRCELLPKVNRHSSLGKFCPFGCHRYESHHDHSSDRAGSPFDDERWR